MRLKQVYGVAFKLKHKQISINELVRRSMTILDTTIVTTLWSVAERLDSLIERPENAKRRTERQKERSPLTQLAEDPSVQ